MSFWKSAQIALTAILTLSAFSIAQYSAPSPGGPLFAWPEGKRAALSLSFDDARPSQVDNGVPLFARTGAKVTFYVSPSRVPERLESWKKAIAAGHEIGNHSINHPCSGNFPWSRSKALEEYTLEQMRSELGGANQEVRKWLGVMPATFAYPCGQKFVGRGRTLKSYVPLVAEYFIAGRGWLDESPNDPLFCDLSQLLAIPMDNLDFSKLKPVLEQAAQRGQWVVLAGHDIGEGDQPQTVRTSMLEALCRYAMDPANGIWLDTVQSVASFVLQKRGALSSSTSLPYLDASRPPEQRIEDLLGRMTLEEKVGQLNMPCVYVNQLGRDIPTKLEACRKFTEGTFEPGIGPGGGFFTLANTILHKGPRQQAEYFNELQKIALEKTRLKIPLLQTEEGTHGLMCSGGTIFPEGLALGSTWNLELLEKIYATAAREARSVGIHQLFTLVVEPNRDPRLGRNQEGFSEDPYFCSRIAEAIVRGAQGKGIDADDKVVAGLCHYPGQSQPAGGLERGAMEISERRLREVFLPPWVSGIRKNGALGVMATYPAIDGVPVHASEKILTGILRHELGFDGLVLSEGSGITTLLYEGLAGDEAEAGALSLRAGVDVGISYEKAYMQDLVRSVREGKVPTEWVDRSVRRVLRQKIRLGLFERPYVDPAAAARLSHTDENSNLALNAAREGIVLLKNDKNILPLTRSVQNIAVIGPNADSPRNQLGDYTSRSILQKITTVLEGIRSKAGKGAKVSYVKGCEVTGTHWNEIDLAQKAARNSDVAIVVVGENEWNAPDKQGTDGEGYDSATLELTGLQEELVRAVHQTGTPTIVVLINGRPLATRWIAENIPALVEAWIPGERGGEAVADILFGDYSPGGRLSITIPRHAGQLPAYYNAPPSREYWVKKGWGKPYVDLDPQPLFEFGFGLSYTRFEYSNIKIEPPSDGGTARIAIQADVKNIGSRRGAEVVQLYLKDSVSSVTTPIKQLRGFEKVQLEPGESRTVRFALGWEDLALLNANLKWVVEPGEFQVMIGASSKDIRLRGTFEIRN